MLNSDGTTSSTNRSRISTTAGCTIARGSTLRIERAGPPETADAPASCAGAGVSSVFTPVGSIAYTPCRPTVITRRRFWNSSAIAANTNGVMSR